MSDQSLYPHLNFPTVIDITLYKHNYYDNLLVNKIKKDIDYGDIPEVKDCYIVSVNEFQEVFYKSFSDVIEKVRSLPSSDLQKNATSLYFLDKILSSFHNLKFIKINVSKEANYSRINKSEKVPTIFFNYKITASTINLTEIFNKQDLAKVNNFLVESRLAEYDKYIGFGHIIEITTSDFLSVLSACDDNSPDSIVPNLFDLIDPKTEQDNPLLFLITDFDLV